MRFRTALFAGLVFALASLATSIAGDLNGNGIDDRFELPGTQPTTALPGPGFSLAQAINAATVCQSCHTTALSPAGPFPGWAGSMMGNSARDPVFWAQLDVAEHDEAGEPAVQGSRDVCLRCHMPKGWLEGRSSAPPGPALVNALRGMAMQADDLYGVQCEFCHRLVDRTAPDPVDALIHAGLMTNPDATLRVPSSYGNGMFIVDPYAVRRGPFTSAQIGWSSLVSQFINAPADWPPAAMNTHSVKSSSFHRSGNICGTCHDVSNPAWTPGEAKDNTQANFPIERTWSEWTNSGYAAQGEAGDCQSCHMNGVLNGALSGGTSSQSEDPSVPYRHMNDVHFHDLTGGNVWVPKLISQMVQKFQATKGAPDPGPNPVIGATQAQRDAFLNTNFAWALKSLFPLGSYARDVGAQPPPPGYDATNYDAASDRAIATLQRAAQLSGTRAPGGDLKVRVWNMAGHKLPTGYPEGRRMWLDVKFQSINAGNGATSLLAESGEYNPATATLYQDFNLDNAAGPKTYDVATYTDGAGNPLGIGRRTQVYEARMHNISSGAEFHFVMNNERLSDNRIPPTGWVKSQYLANKAEQVIPAAYGASQMVYQDAVSGPMQMPPVIEDSYNFDEVPYPVPVGADVAEVTLDYQSVSREYLEELVAASPRTLTYPATGPSTFSRADMLEYIWRTFDMGGGQMRNPPVQMTKLRIALVDSDGDGLPDNWETAYGLNPNSAVGDDGRNGDPDGDGRSNWIEFQEGTPPNMPDAPRVPVDLALVLDFSGSMNDPAPGSNAPKVQVLKDSVALFLKTWQQYASRNDRIAIVYFSGGVSMETGGIIDFASLPPATGIDTEVNTLIAAVNGHSAGGSTALGGGIQTALNAITAGGVGHRKQIIVFTNGMQNFSPMVRTNGSGNYVIQAEAVNPGNGVYGDSGVTAGSGPAFGTQLNTLNIPVHTIGIGVSETPDDRWQTLLAGLSTNTVGLNQFISRAYDLESAFLNDLVQSLRGFSPYIAGDVRGQLAANETSRTLEFTLDASAAKANFILSWAGAGAQRLSYDLIAPDSKTVTSLARIVDGPSYRLGYVYLPLAAANGRPVAHAGTWKMVLHRADNRTKKTQDGRTAQTGAAEDFRAYLVADIPDMSFDVKFSKPVYRVGENVQVSVQIASGNDPVRTLDTVTATVSLPRGALGTALSKADFAGARLTGIRNRNGDILPDMAAAKTAVLLTDPAWQARLAPLRETVTLYDDGKPEHGDSLPGDGIYSAMLGKIQIPGTITVTVAASGKSARNREFERHFVATASVLNGAFSASSSRLRTYLEQSQGGLWKLRAQTSPRDTMGNYLGPGYSNRVRFIVPSGTAVSAVVDNLDGSYAQQFQLRSGMLNAEVLLVIDGKPITQTNSVSELIGRLAIWFLLVVLTIALLIFLWRLLRASVA